MTANRSQVARPRLIWLSFLALLILAGCGSKSTVSGVSGGGTPIGDVDVHLLVVDDPLLAAAIGQLKAEWKARTGANVTITDMSSAELASATEAAASKPPAPLDAIIYPSADLGLLAERGWLAPLTPGQTSSHVLAASDWFELLQVAECRWGQSTYAVPFGSPTFVCYYRADLFERHHKRPPQTWTEYHDLAAFFANRENAGDAAGETWYGTIEPLAANWAGCDLLARAACYAKHRDHFSTLFHIDTMEPLVAGPGFVRALTELVADAKLGPEKPMEIDPVAARREFLAGHAALAITWPGHTLPGDTPPSAEPFVTPAAVAIAELPGSVNVYSIGSKAWAKRPSDEAQRVPLLSVAGRLGSLAAHAQQPENAFQLLGWLSGQEWGAKVASASAATTLYRRSQVGAPQPWVDPGTDQAAAQQYARSVQAALSRTASLSSVRIPGRAEYLAVLDAAVHAALAGTPPAEALEQAASKWREITEKLGPDAQRRAYRLSLGLDAAKP